MHKYMHVYMYTHIYTYPYPYILSECRCCTDVTCDTEIQNPTEKDKVLSLLALLVQKYKY